MTYVIGIDGGGTKTDAVLADGAGNVLARSIGGPTNPNLLSKRELLQNFQMLLSSLQEQAPEPFSEVTSVFAGISGAGNDQTQNNVRNMLAGFFQSSIAIEVVADPINALYSGTFGQPGIVQISGTGSITYCVDLHRNESRIGGWGYLFGDEGSGYDIGRRGIQAVLHYEDGIGRETLLTEMLLSQFGVGTVRDVVQEVMGSTKPKDQISPLSKLVFNAYKAGDSVAVDIIENVGREMSGRIMALYTQCFEPTDPIPVVLCGGVFTDKDILPKLLRTRLRHYPALTVITPELPPVGGSLLGAYLHDGHPPSITVIATILTTLKEGGKTCLQ